MLDEAAGRVVIPNARPAPSVSDDGHTVGTFVGNDGYRAFDAGHGTDRALVKAHQFAAHHGAIHDACAKHVGQIDIGTIDQFAGQLICGIQSL